MNSEEIQDTIQRFIKNDFLSRTPKTVLKDDDSLFEKGVIDSTGVLELVAFIERQFGFRVEDEELIPENLDSISRITKYIRYKTNNAIEAKNSSA